MGDYNAVLTVDLRDEDAAYADAVLDGDLGRIYHAAIGYDPRGRTQIVITLPADDLTQAVTTARALFADEPDKVRMDVMPTAEYDRADEPLPALLNVTQAADRLNTSRQAVMARIERGTLPATRVGTRWAIPVSAVI